MTKSRYDRIFNKNNLPIVLVLMVVINYLPLIVLNCTTKSSRAAGISTLVPAFGIGFVYLFLFYINKIKISKAFVIELVLLALITLMWGTVQIINIINGKYYLFDIFNIFCKFVNVLFLFILLTNIEIEEKYIKYFMKGMVLFGIVSCVFNVIFYFPEILSFLKIITLDGKISTPKSFFAQKNQFAYVLFTCIVSCFSLIISENNKRNRIIYLSCILLFLLNMVFTLSRTGMVITGLFILLFLIFNDRMKVSQKIAIIGGLVLLSGLFVLLLYFYNPELLFERLLRTNSIKNFTGRTRIWNVATSIINESKVSFIFGTGRFKGLEILHDSKIRFTQFHDTYLEFLVSGGIVELLYFISIYIFVIVKVIKSKTLGRRYKILYICLYISYFMYMFTESLGRFSIGGSDMLGLIFFLSVPLLHSNMTEIKVLEEGKTEE